MKKIVLLAAFLLAATTTFTFAAKKKPQEKAGAKLKVVTTIFPEYDWVRAILGDKASDAELTLLLDNGVDLHSYQPTVKDIAKIANADVFVYVGGESDEWVADALKNVRNKNMQAVNLLETLGDKVKAEEIVEGMESEHDEHDEHDGEEAHKHEGHAHDHDDDDEEEELDEHVWLSLRNAQVLVSAIADALCKADRANAAVYRTNAEAYNKQLSALDAEYTAAVNVAARKVVLFGDRFPFRYLADDYGLTYYAAFAGCSAETEASFKTVIFLAGKVDEHSLPSVFTVEKSDGKIAKTVVQNTKAKNARVIALNSMQSTTSKDIKKGASYLGIMQQNLAVLKEALK